MQQCLSSKSDKVQFTGYIGSLLCALRESGCSCYWHSVYAGALCYADDLMILAPSADDLRKMLVAHTVFVSTWPKLS